MKDFDLENWIAEQVALIPDKICKECLEDGLKIGFLKALELVEEKIETEVLQAASLAHPNDRDDADYRAKKMIEGIKEIISKLRGEK